MCIVNDVNLEELVLMVMMVSGKGTKVMRRAKMSLQSGQVKQVIRTYAIEVQTDDKKDLEAEQVTMKLRKAMGANCKLIRLDMRTEGADDIVDDRQKTNY